MSVGYAEILVQEIEKIVADDEAAHAAEDTLYEEVLKAVADGHPDSKKIAKIALRTKSLNFQRWCV